jgi:hypothetical protein
MLSLYTRIIRQQGLKKDYVLSDIRQTKLYKRITFGCNNLCPVLVIEFRGRPMANIGAGIRSVCIQGSSKAVDGMGV